MFDEIIGQENNKTFFRKMIEDSVLRKAPLGHILICGPERSGRKTMLCAIARESGKEVTLFPSIGITSSYNMI